MPDFKSSKDLKYKRVLLKISGESLMDEKSFGIETKALKWISEVIADVNALGAQVAIVIGGGNFLRGKNVSGKEVERSTADYMGMLATIMNALALQDCLEKAGNNVRVLSAISAPQIAEPYIRRRAIRHLEKNRIVIFAAGTGNPYFSTDTGAALRALEIDANLMIKATKVDGVYDKDPIKHKEAIFLKELSYVEILRERLDVMDATAVSLCSENNLPIVVTNLFKKDSIKKVILGEAIGTLISNK